jgi:hypothetical protein
MARKCLLSTPQPSTVTGRGLLAESRGLVDSSVEGWILFIRSVQAENKGLSRGCRHFFSNYSKEKEVFRGTGQKPIEVTIGPSIYTLYFLNCRTGRSGALPDGGRQCCAHA